MRLRLGNAYSSTHWNNFPFAFLWFLENGPVVVGTVRRRLAVALLSMKHVDMWSQFDDITEKLREAFLAECQEIARDRKCTTNVLGVLMLIRAAMPVDAQHMEGMTNVLQVMCKLAPRMETTLANDRLAI